MVIKEIANNKFAVFSKKGKRLTKKPLSKRLAEARLREIEYFKHKNSA